MHIFPIDAVSGGGTTPAEQLKPKDQEQVNQDGQDAGTGKEVSIFSSYDNTKDGVLTTKDDSSVFSYMRPLVANSIDGTTANNAGCGSNLKVAMAVGRVFDKVYEKMGELVKIDIGNKTAVESDEVAVKTAQSDIDADSISKMQSQVSSINSQLQAVFEQGMADYLNSPQYQEDIADKNAEGGCKLIPQGVSGGGGGSYSVPQAQTFDKETPEMEDPEKAQTVGDGNEYDTGAGYSGVTSGKGINMPNIDTGSLANSVKNATAENASQINGDLTSSLSKIDSAIGKAGAELAKLENEKSTAEGKVEQLQTAVDGLKEERQEIKSTLDDSQATLDQSIQDRDAKDAELSAVDEDYKAACDQVKDFESQKETAQTEYSEAQGDTAKAEGNYETAKQDRAAAREALDNADQNDENYANIKANYDAAVQAEENAKKELDSAKQQEEKAKEKLDKVTEQLGIANDEKMALLNKHTAVNDQYSTLAQACKDNSIAVQVNQDHYDNNLNTYNETNSNFLRYNTELNNQNGIIKQYNTVSQQSTQLQQQHDEIAKLQQELKSKFPNA